MKLQKVILNPKTVKYFLIYLLFIPLGYFLTLYGGFVVEKGYGYHAVLRYDTYGVRCDSSARSAPRNQVALLREKYSSEIQSGINFPEKEKYLYLKNYVRREYIADCVGCLILLLGLASLGCVVVFSGIGSILSSWQPLFVMLASMWAFEPLRFLFYIYPDSRIMKPENLISEELNFYPWFLIILLSITGLIISFFILRKIFLSGELQSFLIGSFLGAPVGMLLWLKVIGPLILS